MLSFKFKSLMFCNIVLDRDADSFYIPNPPDKERCKLAIANLLNMTASLNKNKSITGR